MREEWRLFAAIPVPDDVHQRVAAAIAHLQARGYRAKWVDPEATHLTVKFFGSVATDSLPDLTRALRKSVTGLARFELQVHGAGAFPHPLRPRVLWLGIDGETAPLAQLVEQVERSAGSFAEKTDERPFHPHLTLARVRPEDLATLHALPQELERLARLPPLPFTVDRLTLYRSELFRSGPRYTIIEEFLLR